MGPLIIVIPSQAGYVVDGEGCFEEVLYLGAGDKYSTYLQVSHTVLSTKGRLQNPPTNLGFWLNLRWVGVDRGPGCPTPLTGFFTS